MFRQSVVRSLGSFEMSQSNRGSLFFFLVASRKRGRVVGAWSTKGGTFAGKDCRRDEGE